MALNRSDERQQDEKTESIGLPPYEGYTGIPVDIDNSLKAQSIALQKLYSRDLHLYGRPRSYHLEEMKTTDDTKRYQLVPNFQHRVIHSAGSARDLTKMIPNPAPKKTPPSVSALAKKNLV